MNLENENINELNELNEDVLYLKNYNLTDIERRLFNINIRLINQIINICDSIDKLGNLSIQSSEFSKQNSKNIQELFKLVKQLAGFYEKDN